MPEEKIIKRIEQGELAAIDELVELYYFDILRYCKWYLSNQQCAEDATQETFLKVIRYFDKYVHKGKFKAFLYTIAKNSCIDIQRKNNTIYKNNEEISSKIIYEEQGYEEVNERLQLQQRVRKLSPEIQEIVILRFSQNFTLREIAITINQPLRTVQSKLRLALKKLREEMNEEKN